MQIRNEFKINDYALVPVAQLERVEKCLIQR